MKLDTDEINEILRGWHTLSVFLSCCDDISTCKMLFETELKGGKRKYLLARLTSKIARLTMEQVKGAYNARFN